jgi:OmpA-OmpF porin, OOP family
MVLGVALVVAAGACTIDPRPLDEIHKLAYEFDAVRTMQPQGPAFNQTLRTEYIRYADLEYERYDFPEWYHYMNKALAAGKGYPILPDTPEPGTVRPAALVAPETVKARRIPPEHVPELADGRSRLLAVLDANGRRRAAGAAGVAQAAYDCWLEEQEEGHQPEEIAACRDAFEAALASIDLGEEARLYLIFFAWDDDQLSPVAQRVVDEIIADYREGRPTHLVVAGHADRSGPAAYNVGLSERRARAVANRMIQGGIDPAEIEIQWYGETQPRVPTPDGVREPQNRRVEVTFTVPVIPRAPGVALSR